MTAVSRFLAVLVLLLVSLPASAQQQPAGWFGAEMQDVTKEEAQRLRWDAPRGAKVRTIQPGSPAARAGLKPGDIILSVDRTEVDNTAEFIAVMDVKRPGAAVQMRVASAGRDLRLTVTLADPPKTRTAEDAVPRLVLDTGGHMATVKGVVFTPDGSQIVSTGDDKVIRVWDWRAGKTVRTIRGQIGSGSEGMIYAMDMSPNGEFLAVGGLMPEDAIRVYDFRAGTLVALLRGHSDAVFSLAFSPDGSRLLSGGGDAAAIIWDARQWTQIHRLTGHGDQIHAVAFTRDGSTAVTACDDTFVRLWSVAGGELTATLAGHQDRVHALATSGTDQTIASGDRSGVIRLWDGKEKRAIRVLADQATSVGGLKFSADSKSLISAISKTRGDTRPFGVRVFDVASGRELAGYGNHDDVVLALAVSAKSQLVATSGGHDRSIHVWDARTGEGKRILVGSGSPVWMAAFTAEGAQLGWGNTWKRHDPARGYGRIEWSLSLPRAKTATGTPHRVTDGAASTFPAPRVAQGGYTLSHRKGGTYGLDAILDIARDGRVVASVVRDANDGYQHRSYAFTPSGQAIISGGDGGTLAAYDLRGRLIGQYIGHEGDVWAVAPSPDGRLLLSGSADQTVRLWNIETRELIVSLFRGSDGEWVMWTPQGYYMGSPGADKIIGWHINKSPTEAADYVGADQLRHHLNRPDIVEKAITLASAEKAIAESHGTSFKLADLLSRPVPRFNILSPSSGTAQSGGRVRVKIRIDELPDPIKYIRVQVNGRQVEEINAHIGSGGLEFGERTLDVPLARGRNDISVTLGNVVGLKTKSITVAHDADGDLDKRGTLYILAVGVDRYPGLGNTCGPNSNASCDLRFSGADARRLADSAERRLGPAHTRIIKRVLVNGGAPNDAPTAANILDAIDVLKQSRETDTVLLFIAGHGTNDGSSYRFLATNAERVGDNFRSATVVPWQFLQDAIETTRGRRILFIDTCHSGNAYNQQLGNAAYHANIIAYTAARFDQEALEDDKLGHGLFTYAVVEGLDGKGTMPSKRELSTRELADYVVKRVDQLAKAMKGEQEPQYFKGRDADDYVLARW